MARSIDIAHAWAHQREGRNGIEGKAGNVSYRGTKYISYRTTVALLCPAQKTVLYWSDVFSSSTATHVNYARRAVDARQYPHSFTVPHLGDGLLFADVPIDHALNIQHFADVRDKLLKEADTARSRKPYLLTAARDACAEAAEYARIFEYTGELPTVPEDIDAQLAAMATEIKARQKRDAAKRKEREAARIKEQAEDLAKWRTGDRTWRSFDVTALRVSVDGESIETTRGARIPVKAAVRLWPLLKRAHDRDEPIVADAAGTDAFHIGYPFYKFANDELHVGCHHIPYSEIEYIANELGLVKEAEHETQHS